MKNDKLLSMISLSAKAGKLVSGEFSVEKGVKEGKVLLVIVSKDASDNSTKSYNDMCTYYKVPIIFYSDKETLGHIIGKEVRVSIGITDEGFSKAIMKLYDENKDSEVSE